MGNFVKGFLEIQVYEINLEPLVDVFLPIICGTKQLDLCRLFLKKTKLLFGKYFFLF